MLTDCVRRACRGRSVFFFLPFYWVYCTTKWHKKDEALWRCISMTHTAFTEHFIYPPDLGNKRRKLASHRSCHHVPSHSFLQAGRHFISWLYSFWLGSSPRSSVITVLKMAHPSRWGLSRAINRRAPQRRICLWAGTALNCFAVASPSSFLPCLVVRKVGAGKLQISLRCCKRVVRHEVEQIPWVVLFCCTKEEEMIKSI